jgi:hypothetical protein
MSESGNNKRPAETSQGADSAKKVISSTQQQLQQQIQQQLQEQLQQQLQAAAVRICITLLQCDFFNSSWLPPFRSFSHSLSL